MHAARSVMCTHAPALQESMPMTGGGRNGEGRVRQSSLWNANPREQQVQEKKRKKKSKPREKSCHTRGRYTFRKVHRRGAPRSVERREREAGKRARNQNGWGVTVNKGERGGRGHVAGGVKEIQNTSCNSHFQKTARSSVKEAPLCRGARGRDRARVFREVEDFAAE